MKTGFWLSYYFLNYENDLEIVRDLIQLILGNSRFIYGKYFRID